MHSHQGFTIHAAFDAAARARRDKPAIVHEHGALRYGELEAQSRRLANALRRGLSLGAGERVAVVLPNSPEFYVAALAVSRAGLVLVPIPYRSTPREVEQLAGDSGARAVVCDTAAAERLGESLATLQRDGVAAHAWDSRLGGAAAVSELLEDASADGADFEVDDRSPFFFGFTSGTTGRPKAAVVSQRARTLLMLLLGQEYGCYTGGDTSLIVTPLYHGAGLTRGLTPLAFGGTVVLPRSFEPELAAQELDSGRVTATFMVPTMWASLLDLGMPARAGRRVTLLSNAAALPEHLKHGLLERWPDARLFEIYGSTEAGTVTSLRPEDQLRKQRCVGQPLAFTRIRILASDGQDVEPGDIGQLYSSSPFCFDGYHDDATATAEATVDGYVTAGDLAYADDEGYFYVVGRTRDVIISGGVNVYPREVEETLAEHPRVREAAVIGLPDPHWGERVHAVIVPTAGPALEVAELEDHCRRLLAPPKQPRSFAFRDALPRTPSGKVIKRQLRD